MCWPHTFAGGIPAGLPEGVIAGPRGSLPRHRRGEQSKCPSGERRGWPHTDTSCPGKLTAEGGGSRLTARWLKAHLHASSGTLPLSAPRQRRRLQRCLADGDTFPFSVSRRGGVQGCNEGEANTEQGLQLHVVLCGSCFLLHVACARLLRLLVEENGVFERGN